MAAAASLDGKIAERSQIRLADPRGTQIAARMPSIAHKYLSATQTSSRPNACLYVLHVLHCCDLINNSCPYVVGHCLAREDRRTRDRAWGRERARFSENAVYRKATRNELNAAVSLLRFLYEYFWSRHTARARNCARARDVRDASI